jgi:hypothetical protein
VALTRVLLLSAVVAIAVVASSTAHLVDRRGEGEVVTGEFALPAGWYAVSWTATDRLDGADGCVFGLRLHRRAPLSDRSAREPGREFIPKTAYEAIPARRTRSGHSVVRLDAAGSFDFWTEGSCAWRAWIDPVDEPVVAPTPQPRYTNEQSG